jgi:hypothetical protein
MTTVGFIGSGNIGGTVARLAVAAGYDVVLSNSRGPSTLAELVASLGPRARAATPAEAASAGDIVVVSVPFGKFRDLPADALAGKVVLDTNNYYPARDGNFPQIDDGTLTSASLEQEFLAKSEVVKVFNNIFFKHLESLARPAGAADRSALTVAADSPEAKETATRFLSAIGYDAVDVGSLADSWRVEPGRPAYGPPSPYGAFEDPAGAPLSAARLRAAVDEASR